MPAVVPVAVRVWAMVDPEDALAPDTPDCTTVHANVVPVTLPANATEGAFPEQMVCETGVAVSTVNGLTVTTTVIGVPGQPSAVGVTV